MAAQQRAGGALCVAEIRVFAVFRKWVPRGNMTSVLIQGLGHIFSLAVRFTSSCSKFILQGMHSIKF